MHKGKVKFFNQKNKFGFIKEDETGKEYYVHIKDVEGNIEENDYVSFEIKDAQRGPQAVEVKKIE
ncbi:MAG TPA: cold shock domain-containing protein [Nitrosopumilaceae archaeon]|jgi:CspA family cold shock protein|nr:cold shock domain-containing protein [Nitrosopumilaceae archaeon]